MIDIKFLRENPEVVKENIRKKSSWMHRAELHRKKQMICVPTEIRFPKKSVN